jgi:hypothetical protein
LADQLGIAIHANYWDEFPRLGKCKDARRRRKWPENGGFLRQNGFGTALEDDRPYRLRAGERKREERMSNTDKISQTVLAVVAAMVFSATSIVAAVGPAQAGSSAPQAVAAAGPLA